MSALQGNGDEDGTGKKLDMPYLRVPKGLLVAVLAKYVAQRVCEAEAKIQLFHKDKALSEGQTVRRLLSSLSCRSWYTATSHAHTLRLRPLNYRSASALARQDGLPLPYCCLSSRGRDCCVQIHEAAEACLPPDSIGSTLLELCYAVVQVAPGQNSEAEEEPDGRPAKRVQLPT